MSNSNAEWMQVKAEFLQLTSSSGWLRFKKFSESVLRDLEKDALMEDDDEKASGLRRDARGARKYFDEVMRRIDLAKDREFLPDDAESFLDVVMD